MTYGRSERSDLRKTAGLYNYWGLIDAQAAEDGQRDFLEARRVHLNAAAEWRRQLDNQVVEGCRRRAAERADEGKWGKKINAAVTQAQREERKQRQAAAIANAALRASVRQEMSARHEALRKQRAERIVEESKIVERAQAELQAEEMKQVERRQKLAKLNKETAAANQAHFARRRAQLRQRWTEEQQAVRDAIAQLDKQEAARQAHIASIKRRQDAKQASTSSIAAETAAARAAEDTRIENHRLRREQEIERVAREKETARKSRLLDQQRILAQQVAADSQARRNRIMADREFGQTFVEADHKAAKEDRAKAKAARARRIKHAEAVRAQAEEQRMRRTLNELPGFMDKADAALNGQLLDRAIQSGVQPGAARVRPRLQPLHMT
jgi:hypothetical protein